MTLTAHEPQVPAAEFRRVTPWLGISLVRVTSSHSPPIVALFASFLFENRTQFWKTMLTHCFDNHGQLETRHPTHWRDRRPAMSLTKVVTLISKIGSMLKQRAGSNHRKQPWQNM